MVSCKHDYGKTGHVFLVSNDPELSVLAEGGKDISQGLSSKRIISDTAGCLFFHVLEYAPHRGLKLQISKKINKPYQCRPKTHLAF